MNNKSIKTISNVIRYGLIALGVIACLLIIGAPVTGASTLEEIATFRDGGSMSFAAMLTVLIVVACVALVVLFFVTQLISNPKKTIMSIIGILIMLAVYFLIRIIGTSDDNASLALREANHVSQGVHNSAHAGVITAILTLVVGVGAILFFGLKGTFDRLKK